MNESDYVDMIAGHLNAPYGPIVSAKDVIDVLRAGNLSPLAGNSLPQALMATLFVECSGGLIAAACAQHDIDLQKAHDLYQSIRDAGSQPSVPKWEEAVKEILC